MPEPTSQTPSERDYVFNDETCRALRQKGYDAARVFVPVFTVLLFFYAAALQGVLSILGSWMEFVVGIALSGVFTVTLIAELRWFDVSLDREALREMKRDLMREARGIAGHPEVIESRVLEENSGPNARPELAFGLPPEACLTIFMVPVLGLFFAVSASEAMTSALFLGGSIALSGVVFALAKHSEPNTYPPEDPPYERH